MTEVIELPQLSPAPETGSPEPIDGKLPCPDCGTYYAVTAAGNLRKHKCPGAIIVEPPRKSRKLTATRAKQAPEKVRKLGVALIATGVESATAVVVAQAIPCKTWQIPEKVKELPDAEAMIAPLINAAWPTLPAGAQKVLANIAEQEDLIAAAFLWGEWFMTLKKWSADARAELRQNQPTQAAAPTREAYHGQQVHVANGQEPPGGYGGFPIEPFVPAGTETM